MKWAIVPIKGSAERNPLHTGLHLPKKDEELLTAYILTCELAFRVEGMTQRVERISDLFFVGESRKVPFRSDENSVLNNYLSYARYFFRLGSAKQMCGIFSKLRRFGESIPNDLLLPEARAFQLRWRTSEALQFYRNAADKVAARSYAFIALPWMREAQAKLPLKLDDSSAPSSYKSRANSSSKKQWQNELGMLMKPIGLPNASNDNHGTKRLFWISAHEVTQRHWVSIMGANPVQGFKTRVSWTGVSGKSDGGPYELFNVKCVGANKPVIGITWHDCVEFCRRLSLLTGQKYRLPYEFEWRAAAGVTPTDLDRFAWHRSNSVNIRDVGMKSPNVNGVYDVFGNASEYCFDCLVAENRNDGNHSSNTADKSLKTVTNKVVVVGGSVLNDVSELVNGCRKNVYSDDRSYIGFRVVVEAK